MTTKTTHLPELSHAEILMDHWRGLFISVLRNADKSDASWKARLDTLDVLGLTEFREPSRIKPKTIEFDHSRLEDPAYRRMLVRKLKAPRPPKWVFHKLRIEREKIREDHYAHQVCTLLSWRFTNIVLSEVESNSATMLLLTKLDVDTLTRCLDKFQRNTINGENVGHEIVRFAVEVAVDRNETLNYHLAEIARVGAEERARLSAEMRPVIEKTLADFEASSNAILESVRQDADVYIEKMRIRSALQSARTQKVLDECAPDHDPEASFRHAVKMREMEAREERRRNWRAMPFYLRFLPHTAAVAGLTALFFFMEVGESRTTPWEALQNLAGWLA